jgi:carbonic anhydrase
MIVAAAAASLAACGHHSAKIAAADAGAEPHWTYDRQDEWIAVSVDAQACAAGARQSPIDLNEQTRIDEPDIRFNYSSGPATLSNNGHAIQIAPATPQTMMRDGADFTLLQAHFHDPSEHHLDGVTFPMELHLVHKRPDGGLAVVGVLFREGETNAALAPLFAALPQEKGDAFAQPVTFDPAAFLPADRVHFEYDGSLTTPPCTEGVMWFVMHQPLSASAAQIAALKSAIGENARTLQAGNERLVTEGE